MHASPPRRTRLACLPASSLLIVAAFLWTILATAVQATAALPVVTLERVRSGHFVVRAEINGQPVRLVVDTGCPVTVLTEAAYRRLARPDAGSRLPAGDVRLRSLNGRPARSGFVDDLHVGDSSLGGTHVAVAALEAVLGRGAGGHVADGILGADSLHRSRAVLDLARRTLVLRGQAASNDTRAGYVRVPAAYTTGRHLAVPCILAEDPYRFVVDTGSPFTVVRREVVRSEDLAQPARMASMHTLGGDTLVAWVPLRRWNIGSFPVTRAIVGAGSFRGGIFDERTRAGGEVAGLLGLDWLVRWGAVIDFGERAVYLRH